MEAILLKARPYDFTDQNTGRQISGFRFWYIPLKMQPEQNAIGVCYVVEKGCSDIALFTNIKLNPCPGIFDIEFQQTYNSKGNLNERPVGFKFLRQLKIEDFKVI